MSVRDALIRRGYFPRELPHRFSTAVFADLLITHGGTLPPAFTSASTSSKVCTHDQARAGSLRRRLGILNPLNACAQAQAVADKWAEITAHCSSSPFSATTPTISAGERAVIADDYFESFVNRRHLNRSAGRFVVLADIANCYPSIYTHSIPWALHGKAFAKTHRSTTYLGNLLDQLMRNSQDQQTNGIPIGPDASLVIAEIVLTAVDLRLRHLHPDLVGVRLVDDYELVTATRAEAESVLASLQNVLAEFELQLNAKKTRITSVLSPVGKLWTTPLKEHRFGSTIAAQRSSLLSFFDLMAYLASQHPDESVVRYGLQILRSKSWHPDNWVYLQALVTRAFSEEAGSLERAYEIIVGADTVGLPLDRGQLSRALTRVILTHSAIGHASEIAWALTLAIDTNTPLDPSCASAITCLSDNAVAIIALHANSLGLLPTFTFPPSWIADCCSDELRGESWLLAYEASFHSWYSGPIDYISTVPEFDYLRSRHIRFYNRYQPRKLVTLNLAVGSNPPAELASVPTQFDGEGYF